MRLVQRDGSSWKASRWWPLCEVAATAHAKEERWETAGLFGDFPASGGQSLVLSGGVGWGGGKRRAERETYERRSGGPLKALSLEPWRLCSSRRTLWGYCMFGQRSLLTPVTSEGLPPS